MRGHEALIAMRSSGVVPVVACVYIDPPAPLLQEQMGRWVSVSGREDFAKLDLRPFVGLTVFVHGEQPAQIVDLCSALMAHKAKAVVGRYGRDAVVFVEGEMPWLN